MKVVLNIPKVNELMAKRGWEMKDLARHAGLTNVTVWRVFSSKRGAGNEFIAGILKAFDDESNFDELFQVVENEEEELIDA